MAQLSMVQTWVPWLATPTETMFAGRNPQKEPFIRSDSLIMSLLISPYPLSLNLVKIKIEMYLLSELRGRNKSKEGGGLACRLLAGLPGPHQTQPGGQVTAPLFEGARPDPSVFISFIHSIIHSVNHYIASRLYLYPMIRASDSELP